jgi:hypothetical protein
MGCSKTMDVGIASDGYGWNSLWQLLGYSEE